MRTFRKVELCNVCLKILSLPKNTVIRRNSDICILKYNFKNFLIFSFFSMQYLIFVTSSIGTQTSGNLLIFFVVGGD